MLNFKRTLVAGDIHGHYDDLMVALERAKYNPKKDKLITLGDYVDRGPDSGKVIQFLIDTKKKYNSVVTLKGNHDDCWDTWLKDGTDNKFTFIHPETKISLDKFKSRKPEFIEFFQTLLPYYLNKSDLFVHAGFTSKLGAPFETYITNLWWDRTLWETAMLIRDEDEYPQRFKNYGRIFIGHTNTTRYLDFNKKPITEPMFKANVINMDTGACYGGKLSVMDIKTLEVWQSN